MGRSLYKHPKRNKRSRALKKRWAAIKQSGNTQSNSSQDIVETVNIYEEYENINRTENADSFQETVEKLNIDKENENINEIEDANSFLHSEEAQEVNNSDECLEADFFISNNENWCSKKYHRNNAFTNPTYIGALSREEYDSINNYPLTIEYVPKEPSVISGYRIVELQYVLDWAVQLQYNHSKICTLGKIYVKEEERRGKGLASTIVFACTVCPQVYRFDTENPNRQVSLLNTGAVWGTLATGSTYSHMSEFLSCLDVPTMPEKMFLNLESQIGEEWKQSLWRSMEAAGVKEREYALSQGNVCEDGTPWITVYVDGSWSKRSYGTNFNSLSGMLGIIGRHSGELLFVAVRNKFCSICTFAENKNQIPKEHICYKNWSESAPAMEADMAVEGFNESESMHGVRYCKFIADGDSSVFVKLKQKVTYGNKIRKLECTNHALKNYGKHLYKMKNDKQINLEGRKMLTKAKIAHLTKRAKSSIYEHAKEKNTDLLRMDLQNGLHHVFGDHSSCREGICNNIGDQSKNQVMKLKATNIYNHLRGTLDLLIRKAHLLIENENNNRAERLMNIVARFNMGKRLNLIQRGSYERRVYASGLRYNKKFNWHSSPWKQMTKQSPGKYFKKFISTNMNKQSTARKRLFENQEKSKNNKKRKCVEKNVDYGPQAEQPEEENEVVQTECERLLASLQVTEDERNNIQANTIGQFGNEAYETERKFRLTASLFGTVIKRRPYTPCHNIVKSCLHNNQFLSEAMEYGIRKESVAIGLFENTKKVTVVKSGLWVDLDHGFLGASPDGLVGDDALVEVKCLFSASRLNISSLEEAIDKLKNICLERKNGKIRLKRNHVYYYQMYLLRCIAIMPFIVSTSSAPTTSKSRESKSFSYFDYGHPGEFGYGIDDSDYFAMDVDENDISRTIPKRKPLNPIPYNSPIYYIRLPPQPYVFVPGLGYVSQPAPSPVSQFVNLPISFVSNGKPSTIYQWSGNVDRFPQGTPTAPLPKPQQPQRPPDSTIHRLPGQYTFNGKPEDIFVLRDSYSSLYGDALQNFYP